MTTTTSEAVAPPIAENSILKVALTALAGSSIEWYDFFIYGTAAALVFPTLFFPDTLPPLVAQIAAFTTFAVGFIARPIGGAAFGHFGDKFGRKKALVTALVTMGAATTLIGVLPSYAQAGILAPLGLILLRFIQGFAVGGQWGGAVLLATESAPAGKRGFYGSFAQVGVPVGVVIANLMFLLMTSIIAPDAFQAWGWRIPFLLSVVLIVLGLYVQLKLEETPAFHRLAELKAAKDLAAAEALGRERGISTAEAKALLDAERQPSPITEVLKRYPREILLSGGAFVASNGCFYIFITFVISYGVTALGMSRASLLTAVLIGSAIMAPVLLGAAALSDKFGRRGVFMAGAALTGVWSFIFFPLVDTGSFALATLAVTGGLATLSLMYGPQAAFFAEIFSTKVRYSGASLGYQLGAIFGGAFAPIIATALFAEFKSSFPIALYMALLCAISLASAFLLTETYRKDVHAADD
jgi:MFS family permease